MQTTRKNHHVNITVVQSVERSFLIQFGVVFVAKNALNMMSMQSKEVLHRGHLCAPAGDVKSEFFTMMENSHIDTLNVFFGQRRN